MCNLLSLNGGSHDFKACNDGHRDHVTSRPIRQKEKNKGEEKKGEKKGEKGRKGEEKKRRKEGRKKEQKRR